MSLRVGHNLPSSNNSILSQHRSGTGTELFHLTLLLRSSTRSATLFLTSAMFASIHLRLALFHPQGLTAVDQNTMLSGPSTAIRGHSSTTRTQNPFSVMPQRQHPSHPIQTQSMTAEGSLQGYSGLRSGYHSGGSEPDQNLRCREPATAASLFSSQDGPVERIEYQGLCFPARYFE